MLKLRDRREDVTGLSAEPRRARPVLLATHSVRVDPSAERMALDSARVPLIIANLLPLRPYPTTLMLLGPRGMTLTHEEDLDAVRTTAERAGELGVKTELLRVTTRHPVRALLELVRERDAGLLVFGPDLSRTGKWRFRTVAWRVRKQADCLVWLAPDG